MINIGDRFCKFNHGLIQIRDLEKNIDETAYLLDTDFFTEDKIERGENVWNTFDKANRTARNLFRWSITEELHSAMQPQTICTILECRYLENFSHRYHGRVALPAQHESEKGGQ